MDDIDQIQLIVLLRIYDVLMTLLQNTNADAATNLLEVHFKGGIVSMQPWMTGEFFTDILNADLEEFSTGSDETDNNL